MAVTPLEFYIACFVWVMLIAGFGGLAWMLLRISQDVQRWSDEVQAETDRVLAERKLRIMRRNGTTEDK